MRSPLLNLFPGPYYGANANAQYQAISGCTTAVPTELDGGGGTRCGHWDEVCLRDEIMTGYLSGVTSPFSAITIGTMQDLGYQVDYSQAESVTLDPSCDCNRRLLRGEKEPRRLEKKAISPSVYNQGIAYGKMLLAREKANKPPIDPPGLTFVGDQFVTVYVIEDIDGVLEVDEIQVTADEP